MGPGAATASSVLPSLIIESLMLEKMAEIT